MKSCGLELTERLEHIFAGINYTVGEEEFFIFGMNTDDFMMDFLPEDVIFDTWYTVCRYGEGSITWLPTEDKVRQPMLVDPF